MKEMTGTFNFHDRGVSIVHFIPQGEVRDGCPVIVFPMRDHEIIAGRTYSFYAKLTSEATYIVDGVKYRVAHAIAPQETNEEAADFIDSIVHRSSGKGGGTTIADTPAGAALLALRQRMENAA